MIAIVVMAVFSAWAFLDVTRTPSEVIAPPGKGAWALLVLVPLIGPLAWLVGGHRESASPTRVPTRPVAPDDDPDFLRGLESGPDEK
jgi:hypothetical protein